MSDFMESPRFPDAVSYGMEFGPEFVTEILRNKAMVETRDQLVDSPLRVGDCSNAVKDLATFKELLVFFRSVKGRAIGFRFKDWTDFEIAQSESRLELVAGTVNQYQLQKVYRAAVGYEDVGKVVKPVAGTFSLYDAAVLVGSGYTLNTATGILTLTALQTKTVSAHTVGADHKFTLSSAFSPQPNVGDKVAVTGVTGTAAATLNNLLHTVTAVLGADVTIETSTAGLTAADGSVALYRQQANLTFASEYDVPCRFDTDRMAATYEAWNTLSWSKIPVVELRL